MTFTYRQLLETTANKLWILYIWDIQVSYSKEVNLHYTVIDNLYSIQQLKSVLDSRQNSIYWISAKQLNFWTKLNRV